MNSRSLARLLGILGVFIDAGCTRADLQVITGDSFGGAGPAGNTSGGAGLGSHAGRASTGGTSTGGTSTGGTSTGGTSTGGTSTGGTSTGGTSTGGTSTGGTSTGGTDTGGASPSGTNTKANTCPSPALPAGDTSVTLQVGSLSRSYVLHVPATYDGTKAVPLVLDFHGIGSSGWGELSSSPYPAVTDQEGVVMAFPDGLKGPAGTGWNVGPCCVADVDDVAFARAVIADVSKMTCIDPDRVYAAGVLTGGGMAYYLACHAADAFAAVAPAAFDLLEEHVDDCHPVRPITVISFRGTAVSRVPYEGGESSLVPNMPVTFIGAKATFAQWARINGCAGSASSEDTHGCSSYSGCPVGVEVMLCTKPDGREEPGDASVAWPVLKRHML